jgi:hypothetical protein
MRLRNVEAITIAVLHFDPDLTMQLARRPGGVNVVSDGRVAFRLVLPSRPLPRCGC